MATISRTYKMTTSSEEPSLPRIAGQVIALTDTDGVFYDVRNTEDPDGEPIRRKISGVKEISESDLNVITPMEDILYVIIPDESDSQSELSDDFILYELRIWKDQHWQVVGSNRLDENVKSEPSNGTFYLVGSSESTESVGTLLKNSAVYVDSGIIQGSIANAQKATNDKNGVDITSYVHGVSGDYAPGDPLGTTITFTLGDGNKVEIPTKDTTYGLFSSSAAGLVPDTQTTQSTDTSDYLLTDIGWVSKSSVVIPSAGVAEQARKDMNGNAILTTYVASGAFDTSTKKLTLTKGDGTTTQEISIPYVTYNVFGTGSAGLVPGPTSGDVTKFLRGDHTWQPITNYTGASASADGVAGLVPPALQGQQTYYLTGAGTWVNIGEFSQGVSGLVPGTTSGDVGKFLQVNNVGEGTWTSALTNTTGSTNDTTNKLYVVGALVQDTAPQTYSNANVYIQGNQLYSNGNVVLDSASTQLLTNKQFSVGGTPTALGDACTGTIGYTMNPYSTQLATFTGDGSTDEFSFSPDTAVEILSVEINSTAVPDTDYSLQNNKIVFTTPPTSGADIEVTYNINNSSYDQDNLPTISAVVSYIQEHGVSWTELVLTLTAGSTSLTFSDASITTASTIDVYTDTFGVNPTNMVVTTGQAVLTFEAQAADVSVKLRIS